MTYVPLKNGDWPKDRDADRAEMRARFPEFLAGVDRIEKFFGPGSVKIEGVVNVHGDERGRVTDEMRTSLAADAWTPAYDPPPGYRSWDPHPADAPPKPTYRGKR